MLYDESTYTVTYEIKQKNGVLFVAEGSPKVEVNGEPVDGLTLTNTYTAPTAALILSKQVESGLQADLAREYEFTLTAPMALTGTYGGVRFNGSATSEPISLKHEDERRLSGLPLGKYTVTEVGVDDKDFTVTVNGEEAPDHSTEVTLTAGAAVAPKIVFTNTRRTGSVELTKAVTPAATAAAESAAA